MKAKRKRNQVSRLSTIWNELLFVRYFDIETSRSIEDCLLELRSLRHSKQGFFFPKQQTLLLEQQNPGQYNFTLLLERYNKGRPSTSAYASGTVIEADDKTTIQGEVKFGTPYYVALIFLFVYAAFVMATTAQYPNSVLMVVFLPLIVIFWFRMYNDRNNLINQIVDVLAPHKSKRSHY